MSEERNVKVINALITYLKVEENFSEKELVALKELSIAILDTFLEINVNEEI